MSFRNQVKLLNPRLILAGITLFLICLILPLMSLAETPVFQQNTSHDAFSVPDRTEKKSVTGIDSGKYELVVDSSLISRSLMSDKGTIDLNIEFASGSARLTDRAGRQIKQIAQALKNENLKNEKFMITGHTDDRGSAKANLKLSEKRALRVKNALVDSGISATRLQTQGMGESKPVADNHSAAGRARNRRVTLSRIKDISND